MIKAVTSAVPFQLTTEPLIKSVPVTVIVRSLLPAIAVLGLIAVRTGGRLLTIIVVIVKVSEPLVPPPGAGVKTVIAAVPAVAMLAAETTVVNCDELLKLVVSATPFHCMTDPLTKLLPVTVSVKLADPATTLVGDIDTDTGTGLLVVPPPPVPPVLSDLLQELNNNKNRMKDSSLLVVISLVVYAGRCRKHR